VKATRGIARYLQGSFNFDPCVLRMVSPMGKSSCSARRTGVMPGTPLTASEKMCAVMNLRAMLSFLPRAAELTKTG
jgi:hypothetical protein